MAFLPGMNMLTLGRYTRGMQDVCGRRLSDPCTGTGTGGCHQRVDARLVAPGDRVPAGVGAFHRRSGLGVLATTAAIGVRQSVQAHSLAYPGLPLAPFPSWPGVVSEAKTFKFALMDACSVWAPVTDLVGNNETSARAWGKHCGRVSWW
jgi:hypothetical protein